MNLSVGILYSAQTLLQVVNSGGLSSMNFATNFPKIDVADGPLVLARAQKCNWLKIEPDGAIALTDRGKQLHGLVSTIECLREQLFDVIAADPPPWSRKIPQGRFEAIQTMPADAKQCFLDCELTTGFQEDVVNWWARAAESVRTSRSRVNHLVGLHAERLSLVFEKMRIGVSPIWKAVDSNVAGYDILSNVAPGSSKKLKIEVKGSRMNKSEALFFLTRNEWNTATQSTDYQFHLWILNSQPKLFVVDASQVAAHVPLDQGSGNWSSAGLAFKAFSSHEVTLTKEFYDGLSLEGVTIHKEFALG